MLMVIISYHIYLQISHYISKVSVLNLKVPEVRSGNLHQIVYILYNIKL